MPRSRIRPGRLYDSAHAYAYRNYFGAARPGVSSRKRRSTRKVRNIVTRQVFRLAEKKVSRIAQWFACPTYQMWGGGSIPITNAHVATATLYPIIKQGPGIDERIGNRVRLLWTQVAFTIANAQDPAGADAFRGLTRTIITHTQGAAVVADDLSPDPTNPTNNAVTIHSQIRASKTFTVLYDKVRSLTKASSTVPATYTKVFFPQKRILYFSDSGDSSPEDKWQVFVVCGNTHDTTPAPADALYWTGSCKHCYIDI